MLSLGDFVIRTGKSPSPHPFAHVQLTHTTEAEAARAVSSRMAAHLALMMAKKGPIVARTCPHYTSSDVRVLAIHGLTKHIDRRPDGSALVGITDKGRKVLRLLAEG